MLRAYTLILFVLTLFFSACEQKVSKKHTTKSENGKINISVVGTRYFSLDPWEVSVSIEAYGNKQGLVTEVYAGALNEETVQFSWQDKNTCTIHFNQQDNTTKKVVVYATPHTLKARTLGQ